MNLDNLFQMQKVLDEHIEKEHPRAVGEDRLGKRILAFQVELGELANEARFFKFWSNDQEPRTKTTHICPSCNGSGDESWKLLELEEQHEFEPCIECDATGKIGESNPLLEEYSDGYHFLLSIGNELGIKVTISGARKLQGLTEQFMEISYKSYCLYRGDKYAYIDLFGLYQGLAEMLGFSQEQIEQAYLEKNKVNHQRQETGY